MASQYLESLNRLQQEANDLYFAGTLDRPAFLRILADARQACGGDPNFLTFIYEVADPEWLDNELDRTP